MRTLVALFIALFSVSCSHGPDTSNTTTFVHTHNRYLEMEPCGCYINPLGGFEREKNVLTSWKVSPNALFLSSGTTFVPYDKRAFKKSKVKHFQLKSKFVVEGLNKLGVDVMGLTANDTALGIKHLRALREHSKAQWVTTNLFSKKTKSPLFQSFARVPVLGGTALIVSASPKADKPFQADRNLLWKDPVKSIQEVLKKNSQPNQLIVVLTEADPKLRDRIQKEIPEVNLILGGSLKESPVNLEHRGDHQISSHPEDRGRIISRIDLNIQWPITAFFAPDSARIYKDLRKGWKGFLKRNEESLKTGKLSKKERKEVKRDIAEFKEKLAKSDNIPVTMTKGLSRISITHTETSREFDKPKNELGKLVESYKSKVREIATQE